MAQLAELRLNLSALTYNLQAIRQRVSGSTRIMAMIKADGYGHGAVQLARHLSNFGVSDFGVAFAAEGVALRKGGVQGDIAVFQPDFQVNAGLYQQYELAAVVSDASQLTCLDAQTPVHLLLDSGMGREGLTIDQFETVIGALKQRNWVGLGTHFACADMQDRSHTQTQIARFESALQLLDSETRKRLVIHAANSGAIHNFPETHYDMVRPGIWLYGLYDGAGDVAQKPVMSAWARLSLIKELKPGQSVGYGANFVADRAKIVGVVCVGYADGFLRGHQRFVFLRDLKCEVLGTISMDQMTIDLSEVPRPTVGEDVMLIDGPGIVQEARDLGTIAYERCCQLGSRLPKRYI